MKKALGDYANPNHGDEMPVKDIQEQIKLLDNVIEETRGFCSQLNINLGAVVSEKDI